MRRADVGVAVGLAALMLVIVGPHLGTASMVGPAFDFLTRNWLVGVGLAVAGVALLRLPSSAGRGRLVGRAVAVVGVTWVGMLAIFVALAIAVAIYYSLSAGSELGS